jgi:hypothetical protein
LNVTINHVETSKKIPEKHPFYKFLEKDEKTIVNDVESARAF